MSCGYLGNRGGVENPCNRNFWSARYEKLQGHRISSGPRDHMQEGSTFSLVQTLVQRIYDDDRGVYHILLGELLKRSKDELLQLMSERTMKDVRILLDCRGDYAI